MSNEVDPLATIRELYEELRVTFDRVPIQGLDQVLRIVDAKEIRITIRALNRLKTYAVEHNRVWTLPSASDGMWETYKLLYDKPVHPEHKQLCVQEVKLRQAWKGYLQKLEHHRNGPTEKNTKTKQSGDGSPKEVDSVS